ncbi:MAG: glycosyltransferase [Armatimonadota bacterium]|nr:glycosyltransferase [Armatimonadota bacterium]MDR7459037.1 glycosyltransferase [Armatimonadota bacterium]MDR7480137.1 glycosyltransferase [Armatimonadota bacterium]MDR7488886.1 glycosyltransferase [Armatimonadota bacterium]MDR7490348.1 glycosyltransferase [Armatimonadota bacterium]
MIWVLLPAYNEARNLPALFGEIDRALRGSGIPYRIVVVDDGSTDETRRVALAAAARLPVRVLGHEQNRGLPAALLTGLRDILAQADRQDVIATMDADNTHPPGLLPAMARALEDGADVVIASRYAPGGRQRGVPLLRRFLSWQARVVLTLRFRLPGVRDYSSGYRACRAGLLRQALAHYGNRLVETRGFAVMPELLVKLRPFRPRVREVPLDLRYDRKQGRSKIRLGQTLGAYLRLLLPRGVLHRDGRPFHAGF